MKRWYYRFEETGNFADLPRSGCFLQSFQQNPTESIVEKSRELQIYAHTFCYLYCNRRYVRKNLDFLQANKKEHIENHRGTWSYKKYIILLTMYPNKDKSNYNNLSIINNYNQGKNWLILYIC